VFERIRKALNDVFGPPDPCQIIDESIGDLSDPQANYDQICDGINALAARGTDEDIARLVAISNRPGIPDYYHEWIADALASTIRTVERAQSVANLLSVKGKAEAVEYFIAFNPEWQDRIL
jgi:hypothetical protein